MQGRYGAKNAGFWHYAASHGHDAGTKTKHKLTLSKPHAAKNQKQRREDDYRRSSAPFLSTYSSTYLRTFDRTLSVNAKSEDREACFATSALASFGPNRAMASLEIRPRSKCNPRKDATALFISRAKVASVGGGGARGC